MSDFTAVVNRGTRTETKTVEVEVTYDESVTITIPYESAVQLQYLLGSIGGLHPSFHEGNHHGFRPDTQEPLYAALQRAGVKLPATGWEATDEDEAAAAALKNKFSGLDCGLFER